MHHRKIFNDKYSVPLLDLPIVRGGIRTLRMSNVCEIALYAPQVSDCTTVRTLRISVSFLGYEKTPNGKLPLLQYLRAKEQQRAPCAKEKHCVADRIDFSVCDDLHAVNSPAAHDQTHLR